MKMQELRLAPVVIRYRRKRWLSADGRTLIAPLPPGTVGHFGPQLRRFVLVRHRQGRVTTARLTRRLDEFGLAVSKRQVLRLLNGGDRQRWGRAVPHRPARPWPGARRTPGPQADRAQ